MRIDVVVVNFNAREYLRSCLLTVLPQHPAQVVVVDNASEDGSVEMMRTEFPDVHLIVNEADVGYGAGANQGIAACRARHVLLLSADTLLHPGVLRALDGQLERHPSAAIVGPRLVRPDGSLQRSGRPWPEPITLRPLIRHIPRLRDRYLGTWPHTRDRLVPWLSGAALAIRREAFERVGGFDTAFFLYYEEVDLCRRLGAAGWQKRFTPQATVSHAGGASTEARRADMKVQRYLSSVLYYERHYGGLQLARVLALQRAVVAGWWLRDVLRLRLARGAHERTTITEDLGAWRRILRMGWKGSRRMAGSPV